MEPTAHIRIRKARQNNLKGFDLDIPHGRLTVVTGPSGAGKSSLAYDTLYAEGQRLYSETFSAYARQFLERLDRPAVHSIDSVLPAVAVRRKGPVRTARATVGTLIEATYGLEHLFARASTRLCDTCSIPVERTDRFTAAARLLKLGRGRLVLVTFDVPVPARGSGAELAEDLLCAGYLRILDGDRVVRLDAADLSEVRLGKKRRLNVIQDRVRAEESNRGRLAEAIEAAWRMGRGRAEAAIRDGTRIPLARGLTCPGCQTAYAEAGPYHFSFNNPVGACPECGGYGATLEIDPEKVVPDPTLTLKQGAIQPFNMPAFRQCQKDLMRACRRTGVDVHRPFNSLGVTAKKFVFEGDDDWYGVDGLFEWLETKKYKMHVRVMLARYRRAVRCTGCNGARVGAEALNHRLWGLSLPEVCSMTASALCGWLNSQKPADEATAVLRDDLAARVQTLVRLGLGHLTLDRHARTLSGGELARVHLTRAMGTRLAGTLYVLDEPTVGLHPADVDRLTAVLHDLCRLDNTVVVVEHDPQVILGAHHVVELGPGAGRNGGRVIFEGTPDAMAQHPGSVTGPYLRPERSSLERKTKVPGRRVPKAREHLVVMGASAHNLKNLDLRIPLGRLVCITGVSGSGKSTLMKEVIHRNLARSASDRRRSGAVGCTSVSASARLTDVVLLDQEPIGRTPRSNPATYVGVMNALRRTMARQPSAVKRHLDARAFSFSSAEGSCPRCGGAGFEKVEMQFLADLELRCPDCSGRRFRPQVLEVTYKGHSIADILDLTVDEAVALFSGHPVVAPHLALLKLVGLGYLTLGQPATTLSGGEAQRLKLARELVHAGSGTLLLLDEPTVGLHASDVAVLCGLLEELVDLGSSVVVVEHNLDVIAKAQHVIDLGPGSGPDGGRVVVEGPPEKVARTGTSLTGQALKDRFNGKHKKAQRPPSEAQPAATPAVQPRPGFIHVQGAQEHNLKDLTVRIPRKELVCITGVSGSGKSTLAFDVLFAEGQRRYLESQDMYVRTAIRPLPRPHVERLSGLPPTVAVTPRVGGGGLRSIVATVTEISHYLRLLFSRFGLQHCPDCGDPIRTGSAEEISKQVRAMVRSDHVTIAAPMVRSRKGHHKQLMDRLLRKGYTHIRADGRLHPLEDPPDLVRYREHDIDAILGRVSRGTRLSGIRPMVDTALELGKGTVVVLRTDGAEATLSTTRTCPSCGRGFESPDPLMLSFNSRRGACPRCAGLGLLRPERGVGDPEALAETSAGQSSTDFENSYRICPKCNGLRLRPEALAIRVNGRSISDVQRMTASEAVREARTLAPQGPGSKRGAEILSEAVLRLEALCGLGLGYLTLDRRSSTLSSGEAQRVRLAALTGSNLTGAAYILDEPTVGLHPTDVHRMVRALRSMTRRGCSVLVVEHDEQTIRAASHILDLGPGAGPLGGQVTAQGTLGDLLRNKSSVTASELRRRKRKKPGTARALRRVAQAGAGTYAEGMASAAVPRAAEPAAGHAPGTLAVRGARLHNLKSIDAAFLMNRVNCVTGVSGSGKSTLVLSVLGPAVAARIRRRPIPEGLASEVTWGTPVRAVKVVDQSPIGRTSRSVPATYVGLMAPIRDLMAGRPEARARGFGPARFSFNVKGGRCPECQGQGRIKVEMKFLPDVLVPCHVCGGARYEPETRNVRYRGRDIASILEMTVSEALDFFNAVPALRRPLDVLDRLGLGYLELGQPSPTLSGGEAQRIRLAAEIASPTSGNLYLLDEPTTGLHMADVSRLNDALRRLADAGNTVVVIEHNLDVVARADHILDLGPEGGENGGRIIASGTPEQIRAADTPTGRYLAKHRA